MLVLFRSFWSLGVETSMALFNRVPRVGLYEIDENTCSLSVPSSHFSYYLLFSA